jgi:hypothetical protein
LILSTPRLLALLILISTLGRAEESAVKSLSAPGIENFFAVTDSIYSGGSPETEEAFQALAKLGIKSIITVWSKAECGTRSSVWPSIHSFAARI